MRDIHEVLDVISEKGQLSVLATIISVTGSAYKKEGAMMLFSEDGSQVGMLSAGCLEEDLAVRIEQQNYRVQAEVITYDMRNADQWSWGEGSGCNGIIDIFIEPVTPSLKEQLIKVKQTLQMGKKVTMIKSIPGYAEQHGLTTFFQVEDGRLFGDLLDKGLDVLKRMKEEGNGITDEGYYVQQFQPKPRLIIYGAGRDAEPLVDFASKTGFAVTVADWRPARCQKRLFPNAERIILGFPQEVVEAIEFTERDYLVLMSHSFAKDKELVQLLLEKRYQYFGILGSLKRTKRLFAGKEIPASITTPIGLSIEAEGPEEIAISVMAELIKVANDLKSKLVIAS